MSQPRQREDWWVADEGNIFDHFEEAKVAKLLDAVERAMDAIGHKYSEAQIQAIISKARVKRYVDPIEDVTRFIATSRTPDGTKFSVSVTVSDEAYWQAATNKQLQGFIMRDLAQAMRHFLESQ